MESRPVFADPSGRRHRVLRFAGLAATALLAVCLGAVVVAMTGGPQAPFTQWAAPATAKLGHASPGSARHAAGRGRTGGVPVAAPRVGPSAAAGPAAVPSARASAPGGASATPTNPVGRTPPGHTRSPSTHKPTHVA